jgi:hypothetical protein
MLFEINLRFIRGRNKIIENSFFRFSIINKFLIIFGTVIFAASTINCEDRNLSEHVGADTMPLKKIEEVLKEHNEELMSIPGVIGTAEGLCNKKPCIIVFVIKGTEKSEFDKKIPRVLDGYPVDIKETGKIKAFPKPRD